MVFGDNMLPIYNPIETCSKRFKAIEKAFWASEMAIKKTNFNSVFWFFFGSVAVILTINFADILGAFYTKTFLMGFNNALREWTSLFFFFFTIFVEIWLIMRVSRWIDRKLTLSIFSDSHRAFCYSILVHNSLIEYLNSPKNNTVFLKSALKQFNTLSNIALETTALVDGKEVTIPIESLMEIVETYDWMKLESDSKRIAHLLIKLKISFPIAVAKRDKILELSKSMEWIILRTYDAAFSNEKPTSTSILSAQLDSMYLQDFTESMKPLLGLINSSDKAAVTHENKDTRTIKSLIEFMSQRIYLLLSSIFLLGLVVFALVYKTLEFFSDNQSFLATIIGGAVALTALIAPLIRIKNKRQNPN